MKQSKFLLAAPLAVLLLAGLILFVLPEKRSEVPVGQPADPTPVAKNPGVTPEPVVALDAEAIEPFQSVSVGGDGDFDFEVTPLSGDTRKIDLAIPGFTAAKLPAGFVIRLPKAGVDTQPPLNAPDLPAIVQTFPGRDGMRAVVEITDLETVEYEDMDVAPRESFFPDEDGKFERKRAGDPDIYGTDAAWPAEIVDVQEFRARGEHVVRLAYRPVQFNPAARTLIHHQKIESVLRFVPIEDKANFSFASSATEVADECDCSERVTLSRDIVPVSTGQPGDFASRWSGAPADACVKIRITEQGMHRLTRANLIAAGVAASDLVGSRVRMYTRDREIPVLVTTAGQFGGSDYIEFYGEGLHSLYDAANAYWLGFSTTGTGKRLNGSNTAAAAPLVGGSTVASSCKQYTEDALADGRWQALLNHKDELFDGYVTKYIFNGFGLFEKHTFTVPNTDRVDTSVPGTIDTNWRSKSGSGANHFVDFKNVASGANLTTQSFPIPSTLQNREGYTVNTTFDSSQLQNSAAGTTIDVAPQDSHFVYLDSTRVQFNRQHYGIASKLGFGGQAGAWNYTVRSIPVSAGVFTPGIPYLLDISDPTDPLMLTGMTVNGASTRFGYTAADEPCFFITGRTLTVPSSAIETVEIHNLADSRRQSDYILIVPEPFEGDDSYGLLEYRAQGGLNVLVATAEAIYNEFGYGVKDPAAIQQFLGFAYHHFEEPKPRYVLLAGDAFRDPQQDYSAPFPDFIPAKFQRTSFLFTATDGWYTAVDGDDIVPDMAIGRLPVNSLSEFRNAVDKMKAFESYGQATWRKEVLLVADETDAGPGCSQAQYDADLCQDYFQMQNELADIIPNTINTPKAYLQVGGGNVSAINQTVLDSFTDGALAICYNGHGSQGKWGFNGYSETMLDSQDADALGNARLPIVTIFTCFNGLFHQPEDSAGDSCGERLINNLSSAAAGVIAPSGLAQTRASRRVANEFYDAMLNHRVVDAENSTPQTLATKIDVAGTQRLGDCLQNGYLAVTLELGRSEETKFYHLFMDPATLHGF